MSSAMGRQGHRLSIIFRFWCAWLLATVPACALQAQSLDQLALSAPVDTSSPDSTLRGFIASSSNLAEILVAGTRGGGETTKGASARQLREDTMAKDLTHQAATAIDLSNIPPLILERSQRARVLMLYDTLRRISPDVLEQAPTDSKRAGWLVPGTPIRIVRLAEGPRQGEYVFSAETIDNISQYHARAMRQPVLWGRKPDSHPILLENLGDVRPSQLSRMVSSLPEAFLHTVYANAIWQWLALFAVIVAAISSVLLSVMAMRFVSSTNAFGEFLVSGVPIIVARIAAFMALNAAGLLYLSENVHWLANAVLLSVAYAAWVWWLIVFTLWLSRHLPLRLYRDQSIKAAIARLSLRFLGIIITSIVVARGLEQIGVPMFGIVASLGVGRACTGPCGPAYR